MLSSNFAKRNRASNEDVGRTRLLVDRRAGAGGGGCGMNEVRLVRGM